MLYLNEQRPLKQQNTQWNSVHGYSSVFITDFEHILLTGKQIFLASLDNFLFKVQKHLKVLNPFNDSVAMI